MHIEIERAGDAAESVAQHELQRRQLRQLVTFDLAADDVGEVLRHALDRQVSGEGLVFRPQVRTAAVFRAALTTRPGSREWPAAAS